jgi:hypothetical protein
LTLQLLNVLTFLWFTAANVFAFSLSFGMRDRVGIDPPDQYKYGYGVGKETYLTPSPWIYVALFLVHILFAGTVAFAQWTDRGRDIVVGALNLYVDHFFLFFLEMPCLTFRHLFSMFQPLAYVDGCQHFLDWNLAQTVVWLVVGFGYRSGSFGYPHKPCPEETLPPGA